VDEADLAGKLVLLAEDDADVRARGAHAAG
jgi:hypothetical protein